MPADVKRTLWLLAASAAIVVIALAFGSPRGDGPADDHGGHAAALPTPDRAVVERFTHVHGLASPAWAAGTVYLSTHFGLIEISGGEWRYLGEARHDFMGFQPHPQEPGVFYTSGHPEVGSSLENPLGFMVSRDGGESWEVRALHGEADFHAMAVQLENGAVIYGWNAVRPGLYRSQDGGFSWERLEPPALLTRGGAYSLAVHPARAEHVFAGTQAGLLASTDGGEGWTPLLEGAPVTAVAFDGDARLYAYIAHPEAGLVVSSDLGETWQRLNLVLEGNDAIGYIAPHLDGSGTLTVGSFGQHLLQSDDGGASWRHLAASGVPLER